MKSTNRRFNRYVSLLGSNGVIPLCELRIRSLHCVLCGVSFSERGFVGRRDIILGRTPIDVHSALSARSVVNDPRDGSVHRVGADAAVVVVVVVVWMAPSSECASHRNMHRPIASERRSSPSR